MVLRILAVFGLRLRHCRRCSWLRAPADCRRPAVWESIILQIASLGKVQLLLNAYHLHAIVKLKTLSRTMVSQGPSICTSYLQFFLGLGCWNNLNQQPMIFRINSEQREQRFKYTSLPSQRAQDRLPWWYSGKESTMQCRKHGFNPGPGRFHMPQSN